MSTSDWDEQRAAILDGMTGYLEAAADEEDDAPPYTPEDIATCDAILSQYLAELQEAEGDTPILALIEAAVGALNDLNDTCGGVLIETDQREQICALLLESAAAAGLTVKGDVTEEWREW